MHVVFLAEIMLAQLSNLIRDQRPALRYGGLYPRVGKFRRRTESIAQLFFRVDAFFHHLSKWKR